MLKYFNFDGPTRVRDLKEEISRAERVSQDRVVKELNNLADQGLITRGRVGVFHYYELTDHGKYVYSCQLERGEIKREEVKYMSSNPDYIHKDEVNRQFEKIKTDLGLPVVPPDGLVFEPHELSYAMFKHLVETSLASGEMTFAVVPMGTDVKVIYREEGKPAVNKEVMRWRDLKGNPADKDEELRRLRSILRDAGLGEYL